MVTVIHLARGTYSYKVVTNCGAPLQGRDGRHQAIAQSFAVFFTAVTPEVLDYAIYF